MADYIFLMHNDTPPGTAESGPDHDIRWQSYLSKLQSSGQFRGGSAIGQGVCRRNNGTAPAITAHIGGFVRIEAESLDDACRLLDGNPVYESGGTVEIRELPAD